MGNKTSSATTKPQKQAKWISLRSIPCGDFSSITPMDSKKFLAIPLNNSLYKSDGIYTYIISQNKWIISIKYSKDSWLSSISPAFNKSTNILYIAHYVQNCLSIIDFTTMKWITINCPYLSNCDGAKCIIINDELHLIGGKRNNKHLIWRDKQKIFEELHVFEDLSLGFKSHKLIHMKSRQILLLFGGESTSKPLDVIYRFDIKKNEWNLMKIKMPQKLSEFGLISTNDEKYVILFGGVLYDERNGYTFSDLIFILDIDNQIFHQSLIYCPIRYMFNGIYHNNYPYSEVILTYGFIRNLRQNLQNNEYLPILPNDIKSFIGSLFILEYIHLIDLKDGKHWKMNLDEILSNTQLCNVSGNYLRKCTEIVKKPSQQL